MTATGTEGEAYAILTDEGELIFFRDTTTYTNGEIYSVVLNGVHYSGTVYSNVETSYTAPRYLPWYQSMSLIKTVRVASGYIISPMSMNYWFDSARKLEAFYGDGFDTSKTRSLSSMFAYCTSLKTVDLSNFDISSVQDMNSMFYYCSSLSSLDLSSFGTADFRSINSSHVNEMFYNCSSLTSLDLGSFDTADVTDMSYMFYNCSSLTSLNISSFDTSKTTDMSDMFNNCSSLTSLDLSHFDTSNVTNMSGMFSGCSSLTSLNISSFDTSKATNMSSMFNKCSSLTSLDLSHFDTSNVTSMISLFEGCTSLPSLDISSFDTSNVTYMRYMFQNCSSLISLDLSGFETSKVTQMYNMFKGCTSLSLLDISSFNTSQVTDMSLMFSDCPQLKKVALGEQFTVWSNNAYLCGDSSILWKNGTLIKTGEELYTDYKNHNLEWNGTWVRYIPAVTLSLDKESIDLYNGESTKLLLTILPEDADQSVTWISSDDSIVIVDQEGNVEAISNGTAVITVSTLDGSGVSASCKVNVYTLVSSLAFSKESLSLHTPLSEILEPIILPETATNKKLTWSSSDPAVATVDQNGKITAVGSGTATISVTTTDGTNLTASCEVTVTTLVSNISLNKTNLYLFTGTSETLSATVLPDTASDQTLTWSSSDPAVATVDQDGKVTAVSEGTATITATANDESGASASCEVLVPTLVSSVTLNKDELSLHTGESEKLETTVLPASATDPSLTWSSSNTSVATVDRNGNVTAIGNGTAVITASANDESGLSASCSVTVTTLVNKITLDKAKLYLDVDQTAMLSAAVFPNTASNKELEWSSSDETVATVDQTGKVTAVNVGTAVITVIVKDGSDVYAECNVSVRIPVTSIALDKTSETVYIGDTLTLTATVSPETATDKTVTWSSSNTSVATVDQDGNVTTKGVGTATITATTNDGTNLKASCQITVKPILVSYVSLNEESIALTSGSSRTLTASVLPADATTKTVSWSSSNTSVARVSSSGTVTAVGNGTAVIKATATDGSGVFATCEVTVTTLVSGITLSKTSLSLHPEETFKLTATISPSTASNKALTWTSSNKSVATVDENGNITALANGTAVITASTIDGSNKKASCTVTVVTPVSSIELDQTSLALTKGNSETLTASVSPEDASDKEIVWSSSNTSVAAVDQNGKVTAAGNGNAIITASAKDGSGVYAECEVSVTTLVSSLSLNKTSLVLEEGNYETLRVTVTPSTASDKTINWSSSDRSVARVDNTGKVTAVKAGTAVITASAADGSGAEVKCTVTVESVLVSSISLNKTSLSLYTGNSETLTATVLPENASDPTVTWSSSNTAVATVDQNGKISAHSVGTTTITAVANDDSGISAACEVNVVATPVEGITLEQEELALKIGSSFALSYTVLPETATSKEVSFSSSDETVVTVDENGNITAVGVGEAVITLTAEDGSGITAECTITVEPVLAESVSLDKETVYLHPAENEQVSATVLPENTTDKSVVFTSSDEAVATVDEEGNITAVGNGAATITATTTDGSDLSAECTVTVTTLLQSLHIEEEEEISLHPGDTIGLSLSYEPETASNKEVLWSSNEPSVASVDQNGVVTAIGNGTATIKAVSVENSEITAEATVTVTTLVSSLTMAELLTLPLDGTEMLTVTVLPEDASDKSLSYSSSDSDVVIVDDEGNLTAISEGTATITVSTLDGSSISMNCEVTVVSLIREITLDKDHLDLYAGDSEYLSAEIDPWNAADQSLLWTSSNEKVATVDENGLITAVGNGTALITVTAADGGGAYAECEVTVTTLVTSLKLSKTTLSMNTGKTYTLKATIAPTDASNKKLTWKSSDTKVATVDSNGKITAKGNGTATITATTTDGSKLSAFCKVTVTTLATSVKLNKSSAEVTLGKTLTLSATVSPTATSNKNVTWKSSDTSIATVNSKGVVTGKKVGTATITVTTSDAAKKTATCTITVEPSKPVLVNIYNSAKGADLRWKPMAGVDTFEIMRKYKGTWYPIKTVHTSELSKDGGNWKYIDTEVAGDYGGGYIYSVAAYNSKGELVYDTRGLAFYRLKEPTITSAKAEGTGSIRVTWTKETCQGYEVQYSTDGGKSWIKYEQVTSGSTTSQLITGLKPATTYIFRVRCQKTNKDRGTVWSPYSPWKKATTAKSAYPRAKVYDYDSYGNRTDTGKIRLSAGEIRSWLVPIELTASSWKNYFELYSYEVINKDAFGEITSRYTNYVIRPKKPYIWTKESALRIGAGGKYITVSGYGTVYVNKETNEYSKYYGKYYISGYVNEVYTQVYFDSLNDLTCSKAQGYVYRVDIPSQFIYKDTVNNPSDYQDRWSSNDRVYIGKDWHDDYNCTYSSDYSSRTCEGGFGSATNVTLYDLAQNLFTADGWLKDWK